MPYQFGNAGTQVLVTLRIICSLVLALLTWQFKADLWTNYSSQWKQVIIQVLWQLFVRKFDKAHIKFAEQSLQLYLYSKAIS